MKKLFLNIRKLLFKTDCILCNKDAEEKLRYLCSNCYNNLKLSSSLKKMGNIYYIWDYNKLNSKLIFEYKYNNIKEISNIYSSIMKDKIFEVLEKEEIDYIFPIPITKKRRSKRGYNQTEVILDKMNLRYENSERIKETKAMYKLLDKGKREKNISNAFYINNINKYNDKNILIFDDIITTGATTKEFERTLKDKWKVKKIVIFSCMGSKTIKKLNINKEVNDEF
ncbi:MAG: ComF family protein [Fusobacteria bacterium]|nr:ComF family protein [Fusobacteriota bacterium]